MNNRIFVRSVAASVLGASLLVGGCREDALTVPNVDQPDVERVLATARLTEAVISRLFQQMYNGQYGTPDNVWSGAQTMAFENSAALNNYQMGPRSAIPRNPIDNSFGNAGALTNFRDFDFLSRNAKSAANAIRRMNDFRAATTADNVLGTAARDARALSFAYFTLGYALGHLAMIYDTAAIIRPEQASDEVPELSGYQDVMTAAIGFLDEALAIANSGPAAGAGGWPIPLDWWSGPAAIDLPRWRQIVRSYRARFRAGVARTVAERQAVNWAAVIQDAEAGIQSDLIVTASTSAGWSASAISERARQGNWAQMTPFYLGMADTSGAYDVWLSMPVLSRTASAPAYPNGSSFLLRTPDIRWPSGETRDAQVGASGGSSRTGPPTAAPNQYFRNRPPNEDEGSTPWGTWFYDHHRFYAIRNAANNGPWVVMPRAEVDLLAAEGYLRAGTAGPAIPLINRSREAAGLPALSGAAGVNTVVPGGTACVPRVPVHPAVPGQWTKCGDTWEAMKYEKRLETLNTTAWWFWDARGWGDLYAGTPLEWPVPYQELFARGLPSYQNDRVAPIGTYGFGRPDPSNPSF